MLTKYGMRSIAAMKFLLTAFFICMAVEITTARVHQNVSRVDSSPPKNKDGGGNETVATTIEILKPTKRPMRATTITYPRTITDVTQQLVKLTIPTSENSCAAFNTTIQSCKFNNNVTINSTSPCIFNCTYDPSKLSPLRLEVHLHYPHPSKNPTFVTAQQKLYMSSWTLPAMFPGRREAQRYTSVEGLLCPPLQERIETVEVRITTTSTIDVLMDVRLNNQSYALKMGDTSVLKASPVSPDYRLYQWAGEQTSVLVTAESKNNSNTVCAIISLQNAKCPVVTYKVGLRAGSARYQTFTARAGMVASRHEYPDGIHIIFWPLPDDDACILATERQSNHTSRHKSVKFQVFSHSSFGSTWYIFLITGGCVIAAIMGIAMLASKLINRWLNLTFTALSTNEDERQLLEDDGSHTGTTMRGFAESAPVPGTGPPSTANQSIDNTHQPYSPPTTYAPHPDTMDFTESFNPAYVMWWKHCALFELETAEAQVSLMGFQNNVLLVAIFAALPTVDLIRSYLQMLSYHGDEDQCFFNSRCLTGLWIFHDFSRVFTNIGYVSAGLVFTWIVSKHKYLTHRILSQYAAVESVGVSRHYGLYVALGYGLVIQGLMSSLYHMCPNSVTIKFDMMFVYMMAVAAIVIIWGLRHGDITHHVYPTIGLIGLLLLLAEGRVWVSRLTFWLIMSSIYVILLVTTTLLMSRYGIWSFSPIKMARIWKGWKPVKNKLSTIIRAEDRTSTPLQILRVFVGLSVNIGLILYGAIADPNVYNYILSICLLNLGFYFGNYLLTKCVCYKEKGTLIAWINLVLSFVFWILAITAFCYHSTNTEVSASDSRAMNSPCPYFGIFDTHDAWHFLSSFALFTFFLGLLTLDDDISNKPSKDIHVF